jgi:F-type H+-transporting ATPase subunit b
MRIDWLTVGAQVVNFLVLVFLLRQFLYRPVLEAMARREKRIADRLREAETREQDARHKADDYEARMADIESRRDELLAQAKDEADARRHELMESARREVEQAEARWQKDLLREQQDVVGEIRAEIAAMAESVVRKALADLAHTQLEQQIISGLLDRIDQLDDSARASLAGADGGLTVHTAFPLDSAQRTQITRALHERLGRSAPVHYAMDPALVCGVVLSSGGHRLGWNLADYLQSLSQGLNDRLSALATEQRQSPG